MLSFSDGLQTKLNKFCDNKLETVILCACLPYSSKSQSQNTQLTFLYWEKVIPWALNATDILLRNLAGLNATLWKAIFRPAN